MEAVRKSFPDSEIAVVASPAVAELLSPHPLCDRVIVFDKKGLHRGMLGLFSFSKQLREERFDLAILFQNAVEAAMMAFLAKIPQRMGYRTDGRSALLTRGVPLGVANRLLHHTDYYLSMLEYYGIRGGRARLRLECTPRERVWARQMLSAHRLWIGINPGAAYGSAKRWFPDRFAAVANTLARDLDAGILITGGPGETDIARDIETSVQGSCLNLAGTTTVRQMMAVISQCGLFVTNDSGPMHVAAAFGIPIVALFGPTNPSTTSPLSDTVRIVRKTMACTPCLKRHCPTDHACMESITVEDVVEAARSLTRS
jgi:heptosyltransferase-2